ncbi:MULTISPECIES: MaoC family dehydratase [Bacillaceae]|uniref:MaoC family dehydratase n=1 Tax=Bacillaceae TaxID=186817 RepID=UPI000BEE7C01|nr:MULTISPECIES: MaoC family dehydratase [unclassified Bacillus (in: firmicutes)]PEC49961.1 3-hydroxybutyryl-CoA dehydratase [Bacillus sp. AFS096315]PFH81676.1 3-hydroxybutyryl-CoA dehydratase [Bacillus sp. AFS088145]PFM79365.1 3-hydroxybutyryl-CoA dehydratase [Bacillus sp. AFS077874]
MNVFESARHVQEVHFDSISVGDEATLEVKITAELIEQFAAISTDVNPIHLLDDFAKESIFKERIAHGMLICSFISSVLGTKLPGKNTIYLSQEVFFKAPVKINDTIKVIVSVVRKRDDKKLLTLQTNVYNQENVLVVEGSALVKKLT